MPRKAKAKIDYAELCDVLRIKVNAARTANATPVVKSGKALTEPQTAVVASGSQMGDPRAAEARRMAEIDGAHERGTVKIPVKGEKGRAKLTEVPATEANVRVALEYWKGRKPRADASRRVQSDMVSSLTRRLDAMRRASVVVHAAVSAPVSTVVVTAPAPLETTMGARVSPEGYTRHALPGPAIVQGPNMDARRPVWRNPKTGQDEPAAARLDGSLTDRLDREVADPRPRARFTASQRRNWRRKQRNVAGRAAIARVAELEAQLKAAQS